jgi:hypothetical protein
MPSITQEHRVVTQLAHAAAIENLKALVVGEASYTKAPQERVFPSAEIARLIEAGIIAGPSPAPTPSPVPTPSPEPQLPDSLDFNTGSITFAGGTPVGGWGHLKLYKNGNYEFSGHFHDSGSPSYDAVLGWIIVGNDGTAFSFSAKVHLNGTFEVGPRDGDWQQTGNDLQIAAHWADLNSSYHWRWQATVNWDYGIILKQIEDGLKAAGTIISTIVVVVALV